MMKLASFGKEGQNLKKKKKSKKMIVHYKCELELGYSPLYY